MPVTIHSLLDELSFSALDKRDKGDRFERLIRAYLSTEPEWTARFENVWLWPEWPGRGNRTDTGIDIVAERRDGGGLAAIQCKFYAPDQKVAKSEIDKFISSSAGDQWTERYVFDTAADWTGNAEQTLEGVAQRIDIGFLDDARVDWSKYSWLKPDIVELAAAHKARRHQRAAIEDVRQGLAEHDRGKMIMACGTGKTFTSLKIAEELVGEGGTMLFLVPSIQLLSQSLREWMAQTAVDVRPFAVCSDVRVGRKNDDSGDLSTIDLTEPATTDPQKLVDRMRSGRHSTPRMTVVFSTYQSIGVISQAQQLGLGDFDLVICDEAHRTTGVTLADQDESHFVKVHDNSFIRAAKRLYMTATPRVFDDAVTKKAIENDAVIADMNDEAKFGPELYRLGFGQAVEQSLLTDYKVIVLTIDEKYVASHFQTTMAEDGEIQLGDAAKLLGCWQGLAKNYHRNSTDTVEPSMHRAVAFAKDIKSSKTATRVFPALVERALEDESRTIPHDLRVQSRHVDGTMSIRQRNEDLDWLKASVEGNVCRVLTNARCLSEGVDVPALDAVMFLTPRGSQVDVVQSVGRVMRKDPAGVKQQGYIILPVVVPSDMKPSEALNDNKRYKVVWQVLQALRSHDDRFHAMVNQIDLNSKKNTKIDIVDGTPPPAGDEDGDSNGVGKDPTGVSYEQLSLDLGFESFRDGMYARIVKKVGERTYWEDWASNVAEIAERHIVRINGLLQSSELAQKRFETFIQGLRGNLNESITQEQAIEMLAQHLITRPVFEALFAGYDFTVHNPVAQTMEGMLAFLDEHALESENATLEGFYDTVRRRVAGVDNAEGRQKILVDLYNNFFAKAFKKTVDKLGIVYTPVEIVDFILRSADEVLRTEFRQSLSDEGVHILDGFTGTGTFVARLLQLGLIDPHDLARKYAEEIHANEILLLAYYIAAVNIETTYADIGAEHGHDPAPFPGLVLTDTFQSYEDGDRQDLDIFPENNKRIIRQRELPITVVVGNPPYSSGQDSANDNNANDSYPSLDAAIRRDYSSGRGRGGNNSLYDSYIRAIKWASLRIADRGVIAYVTNGGFIDSNVGGEMRQSLEKEFSDIYIFNLRGNGRIAGEAGRREGRPVFEFGGWRPDGSEIKNTDGGSRATIAIIMLVKNPEKTSLASLHYSEVNDYMTAGQKVREIADSYSFSGLRLREVKPNSEGDWLSQRTETFGTFLAIGTKHGADLQSPTIFKHYGRGLETGRDAWVYQSSELQLRDNVQRTVAAYNDQVGDFEEYMKQHPGVRPKGLVNDFINLDPTCISWTLSLKNRLAARKSLVYDQEKIVTATYRPFFKQHVYFDQGLNHIRGQMPGMFPSQSVSNCGLYVTAPGSGHGFSVSAVDRVPDLAYWGSGSGQYFARWWYERVEDLGMFSLNPDSEIFNGYRKIDNVTDQAFELFQATYSEELVTKDDIFFYVYGLLHSPEYRDTYAADLKKALPRIPMVSSFRSFADAGRALSDLHLDYESVEPYPLEGLGAEPAAGIDPYAFYAVEDKKMKFGKPTTGQKAAGEKKDISTIHYNDRIIVSGIPTEAYRYQLGSRSAIEWIIERYYIKTDKPSGIVNDPNEWSREVCEPRYILDLLARVVTISVETMRIVDGLPGLDIIDTLGGGN